MEKFILAMREWRTNSHKLKQHLVYHAESNSFYRVRESWIKNNQSIKIQIIASNFN